MIKDEIPFTNEGLLIYIEEAKKRLLQLQPYVQESNKLKNRIKVAQERLQEHNYKGK